MYAAKIKSAAAWAFAFTAFTIVFSGAYGAWNAAMAPTSSGATLSSANWNAVVDNVLDLNARVNSGNTAVSALQTKTDSLSGTTSALQTQVSSLQTQVNTSPSGSYHLEATKATVTNTVPVDMAAVNALCKDGDGCDITIGMRDWDNAWVGTTASRGPYRLYMSPTSSAWRVSNTDAQGHDGNSVVEHILSSWDCYFTDGQYASGAGTDASVGFGLMNYNSAYNDPDMVCTLDIQD